MRSTHAPLYLCLGIFSGTVNNLCSKLNQLGWTDLYLGRSAVLFDRACQKIDFSSYVELLQVPNLMQHYRIKESPILVMRTQLVFLFGIKWREDREGTSSSCFESTKCTCLKCINHFCMRCQPYLMEN